MSFYNPYSGFSNPYQQYNPTSFLSQNNQAALPQQQVIQVNGKASVDTIQLAPNSSVLVMDTSAPIVWLCVSDGVGRVTSTPYDITEHKDAPPVDVKKIEERVAALETFVTGMLNERMNTNESNASASAGTGQQRDRQSNANNTRRS